MREHVAVLPVPGVPVTSTDGSLVPGVVANEDMAIFQGTP